MILLGLHVGRVVLLRRAALIQRGDDAVDFCKAAYSTAIDTDTCDGILKNAGVDVQPIREKRRLPIG